MVKIEVNGTQYPVDISFDDKKTSSATMRDGKIILRISSFLDEVAKEKHIESLLRRIGRIILKGRTIEKRKKYPKLIDGHKLNTFSRAYTVKLLSTPKKYSFGNIVNDMLLIS